MYQFVLDKTKSIQIIEIWVDKRPVFITALQLVDPSKAPPRHSTLKAGQATRHKNPRRLAPASFLVSLSNAAHEASLLKSTQKLSRA